MNDKTIGEAFFKCQVFFFKEIQTKFKKKRCGDFAASVHVCYYDLLLSFSSLKFLFFCSDF
ncbi:MAG: hypothetical protein B7Y25_07675 [Alphaproteobacteria bacterium 16-39-46]|nr:MAG: hypothetical protein B7Y25_07675 [Alphaproteobacteria bacterium 16-39-46]